MKFRVLILAIVALLLVPGTSFADDFEGGGGGSHNFGGSYPVWGTVWYGPVIDGSDTCYGVVAYTNYDAALYNLGYSDNTTEHNEIFTAKKKAKLISGSNDFTTFAKKFHVGKPTLSSNLLFNKDFAFVSAWTSARELYGETYCYSARYTGVEASAALTYVRRILAEDDTPTGGGGAGSTGSEVAIPEEVLMVRCNSNMTYGDSFNMLIDQNAKNRLEQESSGRPYWCFDLNDGMINFWTCSEPFSIELDSNGYAKYFVLESDNNVQIYNTMCGINVSGGMYQLVVDNPWTWNHSFDGNKRYNISNFLYVSGLGDAPDDGGDDDPEPPVTWPTTPTPGTPDPTPPEVPTPTPTPVDPQPDPNPLPTPNPWIPIPGETVDITGEDFQDLIDALDEHCKHLQAAIQSNVKQLWENQSALLNDLYAALSGDLDGYFGWLGYDIITAKLDELMAYLNDLFQWLADQMNFEFDYEDSPYDDTSVIYWLKQIWSKLGNGNINTRPTDPVVEPDNFWDWLSALFAQMLDGLTNLLPSALSPILEKLQALTSKFPFSLPWDVAALLGMLVAAPVTPSADFPIYALEDGFSLVQVGSYHIDLSAYNNVWEGIRWIERVGFLVFLLMSTDKFFSFLRPLSIR